MPGTENRKHTFIKKPLKHWGTGLCLVLALSLWIGLPSRLPQGEIELLNDRTSQITGVEFLRSSIPAMYLDGNGQLIGLADNGIDRGDLNNLPLDLRADPGSRVRIAYLQSVVDNVAPQDTNGHGTHMAGTIVGSGAASGGKYRGIAPGASLYVQALTNARGGISVPENLASLFGEAYSAGVRIHVNGWGEQVNRYGARTRAIDRFVFEHPDFLAIFSAGNAGPEHGTLTTEANSKNALIIGAGQSPRPAFSADAADATRISRASSGGPTADERIKPDLIAPGSAIVSVASTLVERSNFAPNPQYMVLGGSSMAAAVTGGSAALLTQYLQEKEAGQKPSAALLKALLIQGARKTGTDINRYGFGMLDLTTTVLSLQHRQMQWSDEDTSLFQSDARDYYYTVSDADSAFTATLVWTDPVLSVGEGLVNDLDLQVIAPDGSVLYGNDDRGRGVRDAVNNVEQVVIPAPAAGNYTVRVTGTAVQTEKGQNFAVAYGQNVSSGTVRTSQGGTLTLTDGRSLSLNDRKVVYSRDGRLINGVRPETGSQAYWTADTLYIVCDQWEEEGVQLLADDTGMLITSISSLVRSGGYYVDEYWLGTQQRKVLYNEEARDIEEVPDGTGIKAIINPVNQTLYQVEMKGNEILGQIGRIDSENGLLYLQGSEEGFRIASTTAVYYTNTEVSGAPEARPFGYMNRSTVSALIPGMPVRLLIEAKTRQVYVIEAERPTLFAPIEQIDTERHTVHFADVGTLFLSEQAQIENDGASLTEAELTPGQWVGGVVRGADNGGRELISLQVINRFLWGKILYFSDSSRTVYLLDQHNQMRDFKLREDALVMRGRAEIGTEAVSEGAWVRVVINSRGTIDRMDIATGVREETVVLADYNPTQRTIQLDDDAQYVVRDTTLFVRDGKVVSAENMVRGETLKITVLPGSTRSDMYLARVEIEANSGQDRLFSKLEAHYLQDKVVVVGVSAGRTIHIYRTDGSWQRVETDEKSGAFAVLLERQENEKNLVISAQNGLTGEVDVQRVEIQEMQTAPSAHSFSDVAGSLYREEILVLKEEGILSGYPDDTFRPGEPINRLGFLTLLVRATGEVDVSLENIMQFQDVADVPWWGLSVVNTIGQRGWTSGFADHCIHPLDYLRARDVRELLLNCEGGRELQMPLFQGAYLTREEAAAVIFRLRHR